MAAVRLSRPALAEHAERLLGEAAGADALDAVAGELGSFARLTATYVRIRGPLADPVLPLDRKRALVDDLIGGKANPRAVRLIQLALDLQQGRELDRRCRELAEMAAERRNRVVADVRTAVPLDSERQARLAEALTRVLGRPVELRCTVDPGIMGSVVVRVGDEVFDGSVRSRIEQARERLGVA